MGGCPSDRWLNAYHMWMLTTVDSRTVGTRNPRGSSAVIMCSSWTQFSVMQGGPGDLAQGWCATSLGILVSCIIIGGTRAVELGMLTEKLRTISRKGLSSTFLA